jgi:hypothetical protein
MNVEREELELELLVARIERHELDPRPARPTARPWDLMRRQRFIDTILRGWCVPPVHVVGGGPMEPEVVLDGGQRLDAILRFFHDELPCSGATAPSHDEVARLDGLRFVDLPAEVRRRVRRFRLTVVTFSDYHAAELAELLDRLHEPSRSLPQVPAPRSGGTSRPAHVPATHRAPSSMEPIFDTVSAWFADLSDFWGRSDLDAEHVQAHWSSPADAGNRAAQVAADPPDAGLTEAGLPQRLPQAQLVPGAVESVEGSIPHTPPGPHDVGGRLTSYQYGLDEGRQEQTGPDDGENTGPIPHPIFDVDDR